MVWTALKPVWLGTLAPLVVAGFTLQGAEQDLIFPPEVRLVTPAAPVDLESGASDFAVSIDVDAGSPRGPWTPVWRFFGYDEPNFTYMKDGRKLLGELGRLGHETVYVRTHHLLTSGDGTPALKWGSTGIYDEDARGNPVYDFRIIDRIFDTYLENRLKPFVQLGFMPLALSSNPQDYPRNPPPNELVNPGSGFSYPPKDYARWGELCHVLAQHCVDKHGADEVLRWYWEVWNEPNIRYWRGTRQEYFKLYDYAVDGVRRALPGARVGGPHTAGGPGGTFLREFIEHALRGTNFATGKTGSPLDFVAFHAKGSPVFTNGHVRMGISSQLRNIDDAFATVASFPELKGKPLIIGESDPEGCAACRGPQLGYRNGTMYSSYTAASFARKMELAEKHQVNLEGALTWAFEFEDQPLFAGFRALASGGLDLPVLNTFRMFGRMGGRRVETRSTGAVDLDTMVRRGVRESADVGAVATLEGKKLLVMVWHYHDDDVRGPTARVHLALTRLPIMDGKLSVTQFRIDQNHSNAFAAWKRMGSPGQPTPEQYAQLERAGKLSAMDQTELQVKEAAASLSFRLPRQGVSLFEMTPEPAR